MCAPLNPNMQRRDVIRLGLAACGILTAAPDTLHASVSAMTHTNLDTARAAAAWLLRHAKQTANGLAWPVRPDIAADVVTNLYTGNAGVVLFLLELHAGTGDAQYLDAAVKGARELAATMTSGRRDYGLYTGIAGISFTIGEAYRASKDEALRTAALAGVDAILKDARRSDAGADWGASLDIISGSAGTGLFLLHAHRTFKVEQALEVAVLAGRRLVAAAQPSHGGLKWAPSSNTSATTLLYPNFSHGTAGVAYFLTELYAAYRDNAFLTAARAGARYLNEIATRTDGAELIFHHEPGGEDLYYLGWCHGPAGTARLYHALAETTREDAWRQRIHAAARGLLRSGIPEHRTPGFWNNVSQCCGDAAVGEFFLSLNRLQPNTEYAAMTQRVARYLGAAATREQDGVKWIQAEHRVRPAEVFAQTGLMQGAAGVGLFFARLDAYERGRTPFVRLPDSPFA